MNYDFIKRLDEVLADAGPAAEPVSYWGGVLTAIRAARKEMLLDKKTVDELEEKILEKLELL